MGVSARALVFTLPALLIVGLLLEARIEPRWLPAAFSIAAVIATATIYALRLPEVVLPAQIFLGIAVFLWGADGSRMAAGPWWHPLPPVIASLGLGHWWQRQRSVRIEAQHRHLLLVACAVGFTVVAYLWMQARFHGEAWLVATAAAALLTLGYGLATRAWAVALTGQVFVLVSVAAFGTHLEQDETRWAAPLAPVCALFVTALCAKRLGNRQLLDAPGPVSLAPIGLLYRIAGSILLAAWAFDYIPAAWRVAFFAAIGGAFILAAGWTADRERLWTGLAFGLGALAIFWGEMGQPARWAALAGILLLPASLRVARGLARDGEGFFPPHVRNGVTGAAVATVWLWVTRWTLQQHGSSGLTPAWAVLALMVFAAGLGLRERVYRVGGFVILAAAIGRVFLVDVWRLETVFRIISFLVLGAVLLVLGFVYNRFADVIRRWL
jgi:hypothetical protein